MRAKGCTLRRRIPVVDFGRLPCLEEILLTWRIYREGKGLMVGISHLPFSNLGQKLMVSSRLERFFLRQIDTFAFEKL